MLATLTSQGELGQPQWSKRCTAHGGDGGSGPQTVGEQKQKRGGDGCTSGRQIFVSMKRLRHYHVASCRAKSCVARHTDCSLGNVNGARGPGAGKLVLEYMGSLGGCCCCCCW